MNIIYLILIGYLFMGFTWFGYLAMMHLKHNEAHINKAVKFFGLPWAVFYYGVDVLFNMILGTIFFLEIPREFLFTARVSRHLKDEGFRGKIARFFCRNMLDPFDPSGTHCK
jgi:hypothetical protein